MTETVVNMIGREVSGEEVGVMRGVLEFCGIQRTPQEELYA